MTVWGYVVAGMILVAWAGVVAYAVALFCGWVD